ncbi:recombinase family protein [Turicibacter sanguinis]|uniref:recombinase family protein n=1 Tax=Turicibacter sanguinis TaxID=154288 RepID=UPI001898F277|nr:recombinase family protein [Turicibacter sanguinis]
MNKVYGYCRISTEHQSIERQIRNIKAIYPDAIIVKETWTGTTTERPKWQQLRKKVEKEDTIVFDSVSRMSRNSKEGMKEYFELFDKEVELVFLKEPHINSKVYREARSNQIELTGEEIDELLKGVNAYLKRLAEKQIEIAFDQAEKEVQDLRQRTREGMETARLNNKQIGRVEGSKVETKKAQQMKERMKKMGKAFGGKMSDKEVIETLGIARGTYYKYKRELIAKGIAPHTHTV